jgi:hypothetical protein
LNSVQSERFDRGAGCAAGSYFQRKQVAVMHIAQDQDKAQAKLEILMIRLRPAVPYIQGLMLCVFMALLILPLFGPYPRYHDQTAWNNGQLFSEWVLWGLWYPGTLLSVLFVGRFWCGILCPLGALSEWVSRIGSRINPPAWLKHPIAPAFSFLFVTIWAQTLDVRDDLRAALLLFSIIFVMAIGCGLLFGSRHTTVRRRVWCRHLCPIGSVLGVFSRLGVLNLKMFQPSPDREEGYREEGLCPTSIELRTKQTARHCINCARCLKPHARGGLSVILRPCGQEIEQIEQYSACRSELAFIWFAPGLAISGFIWTSTPLYAALRQTVGEWGMHHHWLSLFIPGPAWLMNQNSAINQHYLWLDFLSITLFMLLFATGLATILGSLSMIGGKLMGTEQAPTFSRRFVHFGYQFAPLAMLCILLGLSSPLFSLLHTTFPNIDKAEVGLLVLSLVYNLRIAGRWIQHNQPHPWRRIWSFVVVSFGCLVMALATLWNIYPTSVFFLSR